MPAATLDALLRELGDRHGDRLAAAGADSWLSFAQLDAEADRWAAHLSALDAGRGTHIGLLAGNGPGWLAAAFGIWRCGGTLVPISTFATARELAQVLEHADVELLLAQQRMRGHDVAPILGTLGPLPTLRQTVFLDAAHPSAPGRAGSVARADDTACILYTSGTTGAPKGVMLTHRAILSTVGPTAERTGLDESDLILSTLPLFWVAGLVIRTLPTLATGCGILLPETFTADGAVDLLRRHRVTALHLRPPQVGLVLSHAQFEPALLAHVRRGGGRADWFAPHLDPAKARLITGYGMTETSGYVTALDANDSLEARRSQLGSPLPGVEIRIVGAEERPAATGSVGEVRVRCPGLFTGYFKQPAGTGLDAEGFFRTGDLGRIDAAGLFHFDGRSKDLLRVKGINVSPVEVEGVLGAHPGVEAVYVVGLPDVGLDEIVVALVVPAAQPPAEADLRALAAEALSHYKRPTHYVFIERGDVVLGATSKPQRGALAELATKRIPSPAV